MSTLHRGAYGESPASPLLANSSPVSAAADPPGVALASNLYRRFIEPVTGVIIGGGLGVAGAMGVKQLAEVHHRNRKAAQNFTQEGFKNEYERDKDKENKRINHYEAKPGNGCYTVCGGKKTHTLTDCSKGKFRSERSIFRRAVEYLFEDEDAWDDSDLAAADEAVDVDYVVEDALKKSPLSSQNPLRPKKTAGDATGAGAAADDTTAGKKGSWSPFKKKAPNPDEIKHVTVGGGLLGKFQLANKMRSRAQNKINTHVDAGGCVVVHNKINGQHGLWRRGWKGTGPAAVLPGSDVVLTS
ncbi:hypothetical protein DFJ73DRAFT_805092 [Zopfochytrium polystomum]|nr:hypothetical protein DFJ73DRAFT_805092 [Zopfochytrium polystomum]